MKNGRIVGSLPGFPRALVLLPLLSVGLSAGSEYARPGSGLRWLVTSENACLRTSRGVQPAFRLLSADPLPHGPACSEVLPGRVDPDVCLLEFGAATLGTSIATAGSIVMLNAAIDSYAGVVRNPVLLIASYPTFAVSSAVLSATGTHLVGRALAGGGNFGHALLGGAVGGAAGLLCLHSYWSTSGRTIVLPIAGIVLPGLCAVLAYNAWR